MIQLIQRFYDPNSGRVTLDGLDLRDINRSDFRRHMALVPQDPVIFAASARENIRFGRPDATDAEIEVAAQAAAAHDIDHRALLAEAPQPLGLLGVELLVFAEDAPAEHPEEAPALGEHRRAARGLAARRGR